MCLAVIIIIMAMASDISDRQNVCESVVFKSVFQVKLYNILPILNKLLKQHQDSDSINGRIFRVIGNLSQHWDRFSRTIFEQEPELIKYIVDFLKKCAASDTCDSSDATVNMGVRAFR